MHATRRGLLGGALLLAGAAPALAQQPMARYRATVTALQGDLLRAETRAGQALQLSLVPRTVINAVVPARLEDIRPGSFVGTAAVPGPNGTLVALEVHVFPESMRGTGEGHRPFDLKPDSTMTNGTVGDVVGTGGRTLKVGYKGGEQTVAVPPDTPIVTFAPGGRDLLVPGAHFLGFASKGADGALTAERLLVGKDGLVPPM